MLSGVGLLWPALMIASSAFQAGASIVKEFVFVDAATHLKGKSLDIIVVNSFASGFQAIFILFFLHILSNSKGIPLSKLPLYFRSGAMFGFILLTNLCYTLALSYLNPFGYGQAVRLEELDQDGDLTDMGAEQNRKRGMVLPFQPHS